MKGLSRKENIQLLLINLILNGWLIYAKFFFNVFSLLIVPISLVIFIVIALRGFLYARGHSSSILLPHIFPIMLFIGIAAVPPWYTAYIEYKIRLADFSRDVAHEKIKSGSKNMKWGKWDNWAEGVDFFIYSEDMLLEGRSISPPDFICPGKTMHLEGNYYVFFSECKF